MKAFKTILKNVDEFDKDIKLANPVKFYFDSPTEERETGRIKSASSRTFGHLWFLTPKGKAIFKTYDRALDMCPPNIRMLNEIVCFRLAKQIGLNCAEYEPASFIKLIYEKSIDGVVSYNFVKKNEKLITASNLYNRVEEDYDYTFYGLKNLFHDEELQKFNFDEQNIFYGLYSYIIFDILTLQADRNRNNIGFIFDEDYNVTLAPLFDNEFAFLGKDINYIPTFKKLNSIIPLLEEAECSDSIYIKRNPKRNVKTMLKQNVKQVVEFALNDKNAKKIFLTMTNKANLKEVFKTLENEGYQINPDYKAYTLKLFNFAKNYLKCEYKKFKQENKSKEEVPSK